MSRPEAFLLAILFAGIALPPIFSMARPITKRRARTQEEYAASFERLSIAMAQAMKTDMRLHWDELFDTEQKAFIDWLNSETL